MNMICKTINAGSQGFSRAAGVVAIGPARHLSHQG